MTHTKKEEKSILMLSPFFSPNTGGVETHLDDLCAILTEKNIKSYVIAYQPLTSKAVGESLETRGSVTIFRIKWYGHNLFHKLERYPFWELVYLFPGIFLKSFFFMIKNRDEISVIHSHGIVASLTARLLGALFKKRIVASTHAIYNFHRRSLMSFVVRQILSSFDKVLAISEQSKRELIGAGIGENKITVYRYWVDQEVFRPLDKTECKKKLDWQGKFIVLFVGRLIEIKGVRLLLEAARSLRNNINIALAGDGPLETEVAMEAQINKRVIFIGRVPNEKLNIYYNAADFVIVPSLYEEACGRIILESLSCGTPVIASGRGGIKEVLPKEAGLLISPTVENIVDSINRVHRDKEMRNILSWRDREYTLKNFNKENARIVIDSYGIA